jgi:hypothetical protein
MHRYCVKPEGEKMDAKEWAETKSRIEEGLETVFFCDYGLTGARLYGQVSWIVDNVIRSEFERLKIIPESNAYSIFMLDEKGEKTAIQINLTEEDALEYCKIHFVNNHNYWLQKC